MHFCKILLLNSTGRRNNSNHFQQHLEINGGWIKWYLFLISIRYNQLQGPSSGPQHMFLLLLVLGTCSGSEDFVVLSVQSVERSEANIRWGEAPCQHCNLSAGQPGVPVWVWEAALVPVQEILRDKWYSAGRGRQAPHRGQQIHLADFPELNIFHLQLDHIQPREHFLKNW